MRQIKFRGKHAKTGEWIYGSLLTWPDGFTMIYDTLLSDRSMAGHPVNPNTVGQFTGLLDKKDNEIYEGDIMYSEFSDGSGGHSLIGSNESIASFGMMDAYSYQSKQEGYDFPEFKNYVLIAHLQKALICEVVGNIYDNPELLNVKKS